MKKLLLLASVFVILCSCSVHQPVSDLELVDHILKNNSIWSMAFESDGTAWLGTQEEGLIKVDTNGILQVFNSDNSIINEESTIRDIEVDSQDRVWISNDGLVCYESGQFTRYDSTNSIIPQNYVRSIAIDKLDRVWATSFGSGEDAGLVLYDSGNFQLFTEENSNIPDERIWDVEVDNDNSIWLLARSKFVKYNGVSWTTYDNDDFGFTPYMISDIAIDNDNRVCAVINYAASSSIHENDVPSLFIYNQNRTLVFNQKALMFPSVYVDSDNYVWCADFSGTGVFDGIAYNESYIDKASMTVCESPDGKIWIGCNDGVYIYQK